MYEILRVISGIPAPFNMVVFIVMFGCLAGVVTHALTEIRKYCSHREELEFKRELVDRGMTSEEIDLVMRSTAEKKEQAA